VLPARVFSFWLPQAVTIICFRPILYNAGIAKPQAGKVVSQSILPVRLLNALNYWLLVAAIKTKPPGVTTGAIIKILLPLAIHGAGAPVL